MGCVAYAWGWHISLYYIAIHGASLIGPWHGSTAWSLSIQIDLKSSGRGVAW